MNALDANPDDLNAAGGPDAAASAPAPAEGRPARPGPIAEWAPVAAVAAVVCLAYAPNLRGLVDTWNRDPDYSHGYLVIPIALAIFWRLWPADAARSPAPLGWVLVVAALAARIFFHGRGSLWTETATLFPLIVGLGLARLGWGIFRRVWPGFAFLIFLFPLPPAINTSVSQPLQRVATVCSCLVLKATGLWVMSEGNVIRVDTHSLEVQKACSGLAMLMSLSATVVAAASLIPMTHLKRAVLLLSIVPVALLSNVLRISATAWCYHLFGQEVGSKYAHDAAGWLMMPTAMALVALELAVVSWLFVEAEEQPGRTGALFGAADRPVANLAGGPR